jgi:sulfide:quinone oxidoreductase
VIAARILILGAGFGGLELATILSDALGDEGDITLLDAADAFVFGYSKLDVMFGRKTLEEVRVPYRAFDKPGVRFIQETVVDIDPDAKRVLTGEGGIYEADYLVIALGADYDFDATPGLADATEFYSVAGAARLRELLPGFTSGRAVVGVCGAPFKCPPAPSEAALMLHDYLMERGHRDACEITLVIPFGTPVPPSPDTSEALVQAFAERGIEFVAGRRVAAVHEAAAVLDDGSVLPYDLFLGIPKHRAPGVVLESGLAVDGYVPVDPATLATRIPGVYAVGDVATVGVPKAGVFAEGAAKVVAAEILAELQGGEVEDYAGRGSCYIEFGAGRIGRVDVDFFGGPKPTGTFQAPSVELAAEKRDFGSSRRARWFGLA